MEKIDFHSYIKENSENISAFGVFIAVFIFINSNFRENLSGPSLFSLVVLILLLFIFANLIESGNKKDYDSTTNIFKFFLWFVMIYIAVITFQFIEEDTEFVSQLLNVIFVLIGGFIGYKISDKVYKKGKVWKILAILSSLIILYWLFFFNGTHFLNDIGINLSLWMNINILQIPLSNITTFFLFSFSFVTLYKTISSMIKKYNQFSNKSF